MNRRTRYWLGIVLFLTALLGNLLLSESGDLEGWSGSVRTWYRIGVFAIVGIGTWLMWTGGRRIGRQ
jgi:hypothetical protein